MAGGVDDLPDDPAELKRIIAERNRAIEAMEQQIDADRLRHKAEIDVSVR